MSSPVSLLTRWLGWRFLRTYLVFAFTTAVVFLLVDGLINVRALGWSSAALRYARMLPELFYVLSPFFTLLSALWVIGALLRSREMVALAGAGYSPLQVALPFLALALLLAPVSWADRELLLPALADLRRAHESRRRVPPPRSLPDGQGGVLAAQRFNPPTQELVHPRYVRLTADGREDWTIIAEAARHSAERGGWIFQRGVVIHSGSPESLESIPPAGTFLRSEIRLSDVHAAMWSPDFLSAAQLKEQIGRTPLFRHLAIQYYERYLQPLAGVALLLISIPVVLGGDAGGSILRFVSCIGIAITYFVLNTMTFELGARDALNPGLAAALPLLVTGGIGAVLIWRTG